MRFSTRRAAAKTNYNEDDDLGLSEEDTENLTPNYWAYVDDNTPAIDQVLNHRLKDGAGENTQQLDAYEYKRLMQILDSTDPDKHDFEFFVSLHCVVTWFQYTANANLRSNGKDRPTTTPLGNLGRASPHTAAFVGSKITIARS